MHSKFTFVFAAPGGPRDKTKLVRPPNADRAVSLSKMGKTAKKITKLLRSLWCCSKTGCDTDADIGIPIFHPLFQEEADSFDNHACDVNVIHAVENEASIQMQDCEEQHPADVAVYQEEDPENVSAEEERDPSTGDTDAASIASSLCSIDSIEEDWPSDGYEAEGAVNCEGDLAPHCL